MNNLCAILGVVFLVGCRATSPAQLPNQAQSASPDTLKVLAVSGSDTVFLSQEPGSNQLIWVSVTSEGTERWESSSLYMAYPDVTLANMDDDSKPDLFYTVQYEEFIFGKLLLGGPHRAQEAFRSSERACRVPVLRDVTGDGQLEILDYEAGALEPEECAGDPVATICQQRFPTEWIQVYKLQADGSFQPDSLGARRFYGEMAERYHAASSELARALDADRSLIGSARCDGAMVAHLTGMAERARQIAGMP